MLKITVRYISGGLTLALEGNLAGAWVKELERCWRSNDGMQPSRPVRVDLSSVTFIDEEGKALLKKMHREGAELAASGCMIKCIVKEIVESGTKNDGGRLK
jgi:ABC-type transporter Mla MlaB component